MRYRWLISPITTLTFLLTLALSVCNSMPMQLNSPVLIASEVERKDVDFDTISSQARLRRKKPITAGAEVIASNIGVWAFSKYYQKEDYASIDIQTMKSNFKNGFTWDSDGFMCNQFAHPYHGAAYYNAARSNGMGYWESSFYSLLGSGMWEMLMERERPSYNDIINTPFGGAILGEILFRTSSLIVDEGSRGPERFVREFGILLLNPVHAVTRLAHGESWRYGPSQSRRDYTIRLSVGGSNAFYGWLVKSQKSYLFARFNMDYGLLLDPPQHEKPFDWFSVHAEIHVSRDPKDNIVRIAASGVFTDKALRLFNHTSSVIGLYEEYQLIKNSLFQFAATNAALRIANRTVMSTTCDLQTTAGISAILLGGTNSEYAQANQKEYNIGPGSGWEMEIRLSVKGLGGVYVNHKHFWLHTLNGNESEELVDLSSFGVNCSIEYTTMVGIEFRFYDRLGHYRHFPDVYNMISSACLYVNVTLSRQPEKPSI